MAVSLHGNNGLITTNGTAAAPSLAAPDNDTGFFFGTNLIKASTSGTERLHITSNGRLNIGTGELDQTDRMLNVYGGRARISGIPANSNSFEVYASSTTGQSHGMLIDAGTNSSDINAHFRQKGGANLLQIKGDGKVSIGALQTTHTLGITGGTSSQLLVKGQEADIWLTSTGGSATTWRILGSTGGSTHQFRVYDATNSRDAFTISNDGNIGVYGIPVPSFSAINSVSAGNVRGIEIFRDGSDTGTALKLSGDNGSGTKAWSQLGFSGANATAHWSNYNTSGNQVGQIVISSTGIIGVNTATPEGKGIDVTHSRTNAYSATSDHRNLAQIIARNGSDAPDRFASISIVSGGSTQAEGSINLVQTGNYTGDLTFKLRTAVSAWSEKLRIKANGQIGINMAPSSDAMVAIKNADDSNYNVFDCYNDNGNKMGGFSQNSSGDGTVAVRKNDGTLSAMLRSNGDSYITGGRLLVGTTAHSISSSELFEVKSTGSGFSHFRNNSSGNATIYIDNEYSDTAFAPLITVTDGGGNRAGLGLDSSEQLRITGQGGVEIYTGGTHGGGTQKWKVNNLGDLTHTFSGRHGHTIGSTDGSGAYIMLDGAEGNPISSGTDYMYMEHTSSGNFQMWNGNASASTTKFMDVSPQGVVSMPRQPTSHAYGSLTYTDWNTYEYVSFGSQSLEYPSALNPWDGGGIFTVPAGGAGLYMLTASFLMPSSTSGNEQYLLWGFFKNTGGINLWQQDYFTSTNKVASSAAVIVQAAVGDTFRIALHKSYGRPYSAGYNFFMVTKIS